MKQQHFVWSVHDLIAFSQLQILTRCWYLLIQKLWLCLGCHFLHLYACVLN